MEDNLEYWDPTLSDRNWMKQSLRRGREQRAGDRPEYVEDRISVRIPGQLMHRINTVAAMMSCDKTEVIHAALWAFLGIAWHEKASRSGEQPDDSG